jgi:hypothetical protein
VKYERAPRATLSRIEINPVQILTLFSLYQNNLYRSENEKTVLEIGGVSRTVFNFLPALDAVDRG